MSKPMRTAACAKKAPRMRLDETTWQLFVKACGGHCCECGVDGKLEQGHIQRHADGGQVAFENLIPLCKSCNAQHKGGFTPDGRPQGWRDTFWKLFLVENHVGIRCEHLKPQANTLPREQPVENTSVNDFQNLEFVPYFHYLTPNDAHIRPPQPMPPGSAESLMWGLIKKSEQTPIPPKPPYKKRQDAMKLAAIKHGREAFQIAGEEFLRREPWIIDERGNGIIQQDSWQHFCDCFPKYLADARERAVRLAEQAKVERKLKLECEARNSRLRWEEYLRTADSPLYDGIPEVDSKFIAKVAAEKAAATGLRTVTAGEIDAVYAVRRHYLQYKRRILEDTKKALLGKLAELRRTIPSPPHNAATYIDSIKFVQEGIEEANDIKALENWAEELETVTQMVTNELTPVSDDDWERMLGEGKW